MTQRLGEVSEPARLRKTIYESVDLIGFSFEIKAYEKIYRRHIADIPRINFFV